MEMKRPKAKKQSAHYEATLVINGQQYIARADMATGQDTGIELDIKPGQPIWIENIKIVRRGDTK